jgi:hypothetical protein
MMHALIIDDFVSESERQYLCDKATEFRTTGVLEQNPGGPLRYRKRIDNTPYCDAVILALSDRIRNRLNIENCAVDPNLGWIVSLIEPGGFIKRHIDAHENYQETGNLHLRCNILVQGRNESCYPLISDIAHPVHERGLWAFFASRHFHGTQIIKGRDSRIVFQFGFVVASDFQLISA